MSQVPHHGECTESGASLYMALELSRRRWQLAFGLGLATPIRRRTITAGDEAALQQEIAAAMREILRHMAKAEGYQEAVNLLYDIQKSQQDVLDRTNKERQERIRGIIEGKE